MRGHPSRAVHREHLSLMRDTLTPVLLTGAGFSYNWGGWLANEVFEYLLGCQLSSRAREALWTAQDNGRGFEDALTELRKRCLVKAHPDDEVALQELTAAISGMFNEMNNAFASIPDIEFSNDRRLSIRGFLGKFDAIFTLNQDLLLERHYFALPVLGGRYPCGGSPGLKLMHAGGGYGPSEAAVAFRMPDDQPLRMDPQSQPYFKLHGSSNWMTGLSGSRLLIVGGRKAEAISEVPLLQWYHWQFQEYLSRPETLLMVIGYSFGDPHINAAIGAAAAASRTLQLFVIDPHGLDVVAKCDERPVLRASAAGASRRPLRSIFSSDLVELAKISRFLNQ
jgi:hypothetical protein